MQTIRGRLTAWYSAALVLTLAAFAAVLYLDRRSASYQDLDQRMRSEASLTAGILAESYRARGVLVRPDTANRPVLIPDVAALLEAVPDILIVTARDGSLLFASSDARALTFQQVEQLRPTATAPPSGGAPGSLHIEPDGPTLHYAVRSLSDAGPQVGAIFAAAHARAGPRGRGFIARSARSATRGRSSARSSPRRTCARPSLAPISCSPRSRSCCPSASPSPSSWARGSPDARSAPWTRSSRRSARSRTVGACIAGWRSRW